MPFPCFQQGIINACISALEAYFGLGIWFHDITWAVAAFLSGLIVSRLGVESIFFMCSGFQASTGLSVLKSAKVSHYRTTKRSSDFKLH